jgi:hypothetical protein
VELNTPSPYLWNVHFHLSALAVVRRNFYGFQSPSSDIVSHGMVLSVKKPKALNGYAMDRRLYPYSVQYQ